MDSVVQILIQYDARRGMYYVALQRQPAANALDVVRCGIEATSPTLALREFAHRLASLECIGA